MTKQEEKEIRDKFQTFADSIIWSNDDGSEKYLGVGNMADYWIDIIKAREKRLLKEVGKVVKDTFQSHKEDHLCRFNDGEQNCECYLSALSEVAAKLKDLTI